MVRLCPVMSGLVMCCEVWYSIYSNGYYIINLVGCSEFRFCWLSSGVFRFGTVRFGIVFSQMNIISYNVVW